MIKKIITHDGIFHADDVMAVALLQVFIDKSIPLVRTRNITEEDILDPKVWIVDVGGMYDTTLGLYDHHQDKMLHSACVLVAKELSTYGYININVYDELIDGLLAISEIDCNGPKAESGFTFNKLIKGFNALPNGWDVAVSVAHLHIRSCINSGLKAEESRIIWNNGKKISMYIRVCDEFPIHWKRYEEEPFLVYPYDNKWNLLTISSENFPLISTKKETFLHANKFLAVFNSKEDAIEAAQLAAYIAVG
jgi:uncharacterized UPF0160 family protein